MKYASLLSMSMLAVALTPSVASADGGARFEAYAVPAYHGPRHAPDFTGPGRRYWSFRTSIRLGFAQGRMFAGHYVLFGIGCGAGCVSVTFGDLLNGHIYDFPLGGEENYMLDFNVVPNSRLVKAHWEILGGKSTTCIYEDVVLTGTHFTRRRTGEFSGNCPN